MRPSSAALLTGVVLAGFTVWITRQAKALEEDLDANARKIALLDKPAPDFRLTSVAGRSVSPGDYRGKKLLLIFWATWNNGSHPAMTMVSMLDQQFHTPDSGFDIVAIAVDDQVAAVRQFVANGKIAFPVLLDPNKAVANAYQIRSVPTMLILDPDGKITYGTVGLPQGRQGEFAQRLGLPPGGFRMPMGGARGRRN